MGILKQMRGLQPTGVRAVPINAKANVGLTNIYVAALKKGTSITVEECAEHVYIIPEIEQIFGSPEDIAKYIGDVLREDLAEFIGCKVSGQASTAFASAIGIKVE